MLLDGSRCKNQVSDFFVIGLFVHISLERVSNSNGAFCDDTAIKSMYGQLESSTFKCFLEGGHLETGNHKIVCCATKQCFMPPKFTFPANH
jgi:hypothetical protein